MCVGGGERIFSCGCVRWGDAEDNHNHFPHYTLLYNYTLTIFSAQLQTLLLLITFFFLILIYARQAKRALAYKVASKLFCRRAL
jgi:hypothetical protein